MLTLDEGGGGSICIFGGFSSTVPFFLLLGAVGLTGTSSLLSSLLSIIHAGNSVTVNNGSFIARKLDIRLEWFFCSNTKYVFVQIK
jgi:hypothetical protein